MYVLFERLAAQLVNSKMLGGARKGEINLPCLY